MFLVQLAVFTSGFALCSCYSSDLDYEKVPSVGITILVRSKDNSLPYFLTCLLHQNYPKDRIHVWFILDHNENRTSDIIQSFVSEEKKKYAEVLVPQKKYDKHHLDETASSGSHKGSKYVAVLREEALEFARKRNTDYHFMLESDVFLTTESALRLLVKKNKTVVAPLLLASGVYSNFWCGMTEDLHYKWTEEYDKIRNRKEIGCFQVPVVHSAVLVKTKRINSDHLVYDKNKLEKYNGPDDDNIVFALSAAVNGIDLFVCNDHQYGFMQIPSKDAADSLQESDQILNTKLLALAHGVNIPLVEHLKKYVRYPLSGNFGMNQIFMINLPRRYERFVLMQQSFKELGMTVQTVSAVDGKQLNIQKLPKGVQLMPGYEDPYHKRPMKTGEVGCFLSHYKIWENIAQNRYEQALILEDDVYFHSDFRRKFIQLQLEMDALEDWDLVYIGRKIMHPETEVSVSERIVRPGYTYWTLGYILSLSGAKKLLAADPLSKLLPVDEFLPIMFDQHPNDTWKSFFPVRNLIAYSADPLLIEPTHYTGESGYISDTEDSPVLDIHTNLRPEL